MKVCLALNLKYVKPHFSSCLFSSLSSSQRDGLSVTLLLLRMYSVLMPQSHILSLPFFFNLPLSSQSSDIAMVSFLSASLSLGSLCHLGYHLKTRLLKRNKYFLSSFPTFVLPFPSYPTYCFQTYLKALISSCHSLNKNCSVFTLHPISGCNIATTLSSVFFFYSFPTHSLPSN